MGKLTLRRVSDSYYRIDSEGYPLQLQTGPAVVKAIGEPDKEKSANPKRALRLELCNEHAGAANYEEITTIDRALQNALRDDERKLGRAGVLMPMFGIPHTLPSGLLFVADMQPPTALYREAAVPKKTGARNMPAQIADFGTDSRVKIIFEVVGMRRHPACECVWTYDTVVSEMLLLASPATTAPPTTHTAATSTVDTATAAPAHEPTPCPFDKEREAALLASYVDVVETESHHEMPDVTARPTFQSP
jgi:hypothetical protein